MLLLVQYTLIFASVLILVALGGCFSEHSGVINLGLEGIMVIGALGGALAMRMLTGAVSGAAMVLLVLLAAIVFGVAYSALLGVASINFKADQTLVGTALNLLGTAGATVIVKAINTAANPDDVSSTVQYVEAKKAFLLNINGFEFNWFMLIAVLAVVAAYVTLYKTRFGLRLMACGEHPQAAASVGISVYKMRWAGVLISGMLGGLGGICYILAGVSEWKFENGVAGFGFLALAVRPVPRAVERLRGLPVPCADEHPRLGVQHDAVHHLSGRSGLYVQEFQSAEGGGHSLRQGTALIIWHFHSRRTESGSPARVLQ